MEMDTPNKIWLELELPTDVEPAARNEVAKARAAAANKMLRKLGDMKTEFQWDERERRYTIYFGDMSGAWELEDAGYWFNLDALAA